MGDVVGSAFDMGYETKSTDFELFSEHSVFTDDTVLTLAVAAALQESLTDDQPLSFTLVRSMKTLGRAYGDAGYGLMFQRWLNSRVIYERPYRSHGNGAAMRVSAVGWAFESLDAVLFAARETALVTHNSPDAIASAQATAVCIFMARKGCTAAEIREYVRGRFGYQLTTPIAEIRPGYTFDSSARGSVPEVIQAALQAESFEDSIRLAISLGGDADTQAAIAASIGQARFGIPAAIEADARGRLDSRLLEINDRFCSAFGVGVRRGADRG